jgi:hypothetical protein
MTVLDSDRELAINPQPEKPVVVTAPEPLQRVAVLTPFQVCHLGEVYLPNEVAEVPENVAAHWILNGWVADGS